MAINKICLIFLPLAFLYNTSAQCSTPALSPYELLSAQSRDYQADKSLVFSAVLNALQDEGFSIVSADITSGFISAESTSTTKTNFWDAIQSTVGSGFTRTTIVIERFSLNATHVRISLISTKNLSGSRGQSSREDRPITRLQPYQEIYEKIDAAVNIRMARAGTTASPYIDRSRVVPIANLSQPTVINSVIEPARLLANAKSELERVGYKIISFDEKGGFLATAPKPELLTPEMADCGKMFGISYVRDKRAATDTQIFIDVRPGTISAQVAISGIYRVGYGNPDKILKCLSRGLIEKNILSNIVR